MFVSASYADAGVKVSVTVNDPSSPYDGGTFTFDAPDSSSWSALGTQGIVSPSQLTVTVSGVTGAESGINGVHVTQLVGSGSNPGPFFATQTGLAHHFTQPFSQFGGILANGDAANGGLGVSNTWFRFQLADGAVVPVAGDPIVAANFSGGITQLAIFDRGGGFATDVISTGSLFESVSIEVTDLNLPPAADAGPDQSIHAGDVVTLDGSVSMDDNTASGDLTYAWTLTVPAGSSATLSSASAVGPTFTADKVGTYTASLIVTDGGALSSTADEVTISSENMAPSADAGSDLSAVVDLASTITGTAADPETDALTYAWTITSAPLGSTATLSDATSLAPSITPDEVGVYVLSLVASDPYDDSVADTMVLMVISASEYAHGKLHDACAAIRGLDRSDFNNKRRARKMCKEIRRILRDLRGDARRWDSSCRSGGADSHIRRLERLIARTDGCALRGEVDSKASGAKGKDRDWIVNCDAQDEVYPCLKAALDAILAGS